MNKLSEELTEIADLMLDVGDRLEDEGDRVFLGSTNDADRIRELARRLEGLAARSEALSSPGGQGNGSSGAESAADRGPCPSAPPTQHSAGEVRVRIQSAGWHEDEGGDRYFRFVCELDGDTPPDWPLAMIWGSQFKLSPAESGASGTDGQGPLSVARSARDEHIPPPNPVSHEGEA